MRFDLLRGQFGWFLASYLLFYTSQYTCLPLFPLVYVNTVEAFGWHDQFGQWFILHHHVPGIPAPELIGSAFRTPPFVGCRRRSYLPATHFSWDWRSGPACTGWLLRVGELPGGWSAPAMLNRLMEKVPKENRSAGMAFHNIVLSLGILAGSLLGPMIGNAMGAQPAVLLGSGLRLLAGLLMIVWG